MPGSNHPVMRRTAKRHTLRGGTWVLALGGLLLSSVGALADASKCDLFVRSELGQGRRTGWSRVIVTTDGELTAAQQARLSLLGVDVVRRYTIVRGFACRIPARNLSALTDLPFVRRVSGDVVVHKTDDYTVPATGADVAYSQYRLDGTGVAIAVIDSGVKTGTSINPDLKNSRGASRVVVSRNFVAGQTTTDDLCGHGTLVAGIAAGNGASSTGGSYTRTFPGIARNVNIVSLRALNQEGAGNVSDVVAALQWAVSNRRKYSIRVINLSLGHLPGDYYVNDPLCQAAEAAWKAGIVVVTAAGNGGRKNLTQAAGQDNDGWGTAYGSIQSPGNDPYVITVGAVRSVDGVRSHDRIATYSSRGPSRLDFVLKPDLVAPGNRIISTRGSGTWLDVAYPENVVPLSAYSTSTTGTKAYYSISGTSMAAPVVSGAAALMLQANSALTPDAIKARLMIAADKWAFPDGTADPCTFGAGYLNIPAALNCTATPTMYCLSPTLYRDQSGVVRVRIDNAIWGSAGFWGTPVPDCNAIWGTGFLMGSDVLATGAKLANDPGWTDNAIWGTGGAAVDLSDKAIRGE